jgi:uncharacterized phage protein (TIGR02220 family)
MERQGYILLDRNMRDWPAWQKKPFDEAHAWVDLLLRAAWKEHKVYWMEGTVNLERGQLVTSYRILGREWGWSTKKVRRWINLWAEGGSIKTLSGKHTGTLITVCSYEKYQDPSNKGHSPGHTKETVKTQRGHSEDTGDNTRNTRKQENIDKFADAERVLVYLNQKTSKNYAPVESNLKPIRARLNEAAAQGIDNPPRLAAQIIVYKLKEDGFDNKYVRPKTIFGQTNFWNYAGDLPQRQPTETKTVPRREDYLPPPDPNANKLWQSARTNISKDIDQHSYKTWLLPITTAWRTNNRLRILVPNLIFKGWLEKNYLKQAEQALLEIEGSPMEIEFTTNNEELKKQRTAK